MQKQLIDAGLENNLTEIRRLIRKNPNLKFYDSRRNIFLVDCCSDEIVSFIKHFPLYKRYNSKRIKQYNAERFAKKYANKILENPNEVVKKIIQPYCLEFLLKEDPEFVERNNLTLPILQNAKKINHLLPLLKLLLLTVEEICMLPTYKFTQVYELISQEILCPELIIKLDGLGKTHELCEILHSQPHSQPIYHAFLCTKKADVAYEKIDQINPQWIPKETFGNLVVYNKINLLRLLRPHMYYSFITSTQYYEIMENLYKYTVDDYIMLEETSNFAQYHDNETLLQTIVFSFNFPILKYVIQQDAGDLNTNFIIPHDQLSKILLNEWVTFFQLFPNYYLDYQEIYYILAESYNDEVNNFILQKFPLDIDRFFMAHILWMKEFDPDIFATIKKHCPQYKFSREIWDLVCKRRCAVMLQCWMNMNQHMDNTLFSQLLKSFKYNDNWYFYDHYLTEMVETYNLEVSHLFFIYWSTCSQKCFEWLFEQSEDVFSSDHYIFRQCCDNGWFEKANYFVIKYPHLYHIDVDLDGIITYEIFKEIKYLPLEEVLQDDCSICYNSADCKTNCNHIFCQDCLRKWMQRKRSCPFCREYIKSIKK